MEYLLINIEMCLTFVGQVQWCVAMLASSSNQILAANGRGFVTE